MSSTLPPPLASVLPGFPPFAGETRRAGSAGWQMNSKTTPKHFDPVVRNVARRRPPPANVANLPGSPRSIALEAIAMKPVGSPSRPVRGLSRRDVLWTGGTGLAAGLLTPALLGLARGQSRGAGDAAMDMPGHAATRIGVPRAPYQKGAPLIEPESPPLGERRTADDAACPIRLQGDRRLSPVLAVV